MSTQHAMPAESIPPETLGDRMRRALRKEHIGVQEMADYLGVARNTVSTWLNDRIHPGEQTLRLWSIRTGVPLEWLKNGDAPFQSRLADADSPRHTTGQHGPIRHITGLRAVA